MSFYNFHEVIPYVEDIEANKDENEGEGDDSSEGENEVFPFIDDEDDNLKPNINGDNVVNDDEI